MAVDFTNPVNYKKCTKKKYDVYVCRPPENTVVLNAIEHPQAYRLFGGNTFFTAEQIANYMANDQGRFHMIQSYVCKGELTATNPNAPFVVCGTMGELFTVTHRELAYNYTFTQNGQPVPISGQTMATRKKAGLLDWTVIRSSEAAVSVPYMACYVPVEQKVQFTNQRGRVCNVNQVGTHHGYGDFIVCPVCADGRTPDLGNCFVVNGNVFATTFNNQGWGDCINKSMSQRGSMVKLSDLPNLCRPNRFKTHTQPSTQASGKTRAV